MVHDEKTVIFNTTEEEITYGKMFETLQEVGASKCDILFVHSDLCFGMPAKGIKRSELKGILTDLLLDMGVDTLIFPTFTFSYCNNEDYDIQNSHTAMGMLPEYIRRREDSYRTNDPILSVAIMGNRNGFEKMSGKSSCGTGGIFHQLHVSDKKIKYLFFGTPVSKCFTFLHYVEEMNNVDYRYHRKFEGNVIDNGVSVPYDIDLFVRYKGVDAILPENFEYNLENNGISIRKQVGLSSVSCVDEADSYEYICDLIRKNPHSFCKLPSSGELIREYTFGGIVSM